MENVSQNSEEKLCGDFSIRHAIEVSFSLGKFNVYERVLCFDEL